MTETDPRGFLEQLYAAAVRAALPGPALQAALNAIPAAARRRPHLLALGKAAGEMARAALHVLGGWGLEPAGGIVIGSTAHPAPHPALPLYVGDHPEPGAASFRAAAALGDAARAVRPGDEVWVLLSGGATSLTGAPIEGLPDGDFSRLFALLLGSGLDIAAMNQIRKRFSRWGGGKLATALAAAATIRVFVVSDVIGDRLEAIASGPCVPDPATITEVRTALEGAGLWERLPASLRAHVERVERLEYPDTPKADHPAFAKVTTHIIVSNRLALEAARDRALALGAQAVLAPEVLEGEASAMGARIAAELARPSSPTPLPPLCLIWGGETTVTLGESPGQGGRNQELALAAAQVLAERRSHAWVLSAGTDGRDGPTDAAGAIVNGNTWSDIHHAGIDPEHALAAHDAYPALDRVGALLKPGMTGTNVMDIVIGVIPSG